MKKFLVLILLYCFAHIGAQILAATSDPEPGQSFSPAPQTNPATCSAFQFNPATLFSWQLKNSDTQEDVAAEKADPQIKHPDYLKKLKEAKLPAPRLYPLPHKKVARAILEGLFHMAYATSSYWIRQEVMREDWEYQFTWKDQRRRYLFIDGMRFDSNTFEFNWTHAGAGAIYYNIARANHLNPFASFVYSVSLSTTWEFLIEFREVVSLNDMIFTPIGGLSIGESFFQLGRFFRSQKRTLLNRIARFASDPILTLNSWFDQKKTRGYNQYAFTEDYWHDVNLFIGPRFDSLVANTTNTYAKIGMDTQLILLPEYGKEGKVSRSANKTLFSQFDLDVSVGSQGIFEMAAFCKATFFGYFIQDIHETPSQQPIGTSFFVGGSTAYTLVTQNPEKVSISNQNPSKPQYKYLTDKHSVVHLLGPSLDFSLFLKDFKLRFSTDLFLDFTLSRSHAYPRYIELHPFIGPTKSTLQNHGYYYGFGYSLLSNLQLDYGNLQLKGKLKYHWVDSVENLDRFQKDMPDANDFDLQDRRLHLNASLGYTIPHTALQVVLGVEQWYFKGQIENFTQKHNGHRFYFQFKYLL